MKGTGILGIGSETIMYSSWENRKKSSQGFTSQAEPLSVVNQLGGNSKNIWERSQHVELMWTKEAEAMNVIDWFHSVGMGGKKKKTSRKMEQWIEEFSIIEGGLSLWKTQFYQCLWI